MKTNLSERRACALIGLSRAVLRYVARPTNDALQRRLIELAGERRRFGYRRLHTLPEREGFEATTSACIGRRCIFQYEIGA